MAPFVLLGMRFSDVRRQNWLPLVVLSIAAVGALAVLLRYTLPLPQGLAAIGWNREVCAECRSPIADPHFAGQLQTGDGRILNFDDPGCLLRYLKKVKPHVHALYFHHMEQERWLTRKDVAFTFGVSSPRGYKLGAVPAGTPGALSFELAEARLPSANMTTTLRSDLF